MGMPRHADVDDDGTNTTGTVRNNAWKTQFYDDIDAALIGALTPSSVAIGTTPATTGALRLANAAYIKARNVANAADVNVIGLETDDNLYVGGTGRHFGPFAFNAQDLGLATSPWRTGYFGTSVALLGANGQAFTAIQQLTELTTIAAAATTDTAIQMPAGAVVLAVSVRTTVVIPTATSYSVGDSGLATRFNTANVGVAATSVDAGTKAGAYYNAGALNIRLTMNGGTPAANTGRVRVTIYYYSVTPPTS